MNVKTDDVLIMKKPHPCGSPKFYVLRAGADIKLKCLGCGHDFMSLRSKIERKIKGRL
ncbi:MAG: DUF951 domain-containing protein [Oscillospiraceae bacterium]|nr:DUF951 domain-containing protein [Oscillospiraceae bacterium]